MRGSFYIENLTESDIFISYTANINVNPGNSAQIKLFNESGDSVLFSFQITGRGDLRIVPPNMIAYMFEYDILAGHQTIPFLDKLRIVFNELIITNINGNIIFTLETITDDYIEITPYGSGYILPVTNPPRKAISYNRNNEETFFIKNSTDTDIIIKGEFSNPRQFFQWVESFADPKLVSLPVYQWRRFPIYVNKKTKKEIFSYSKVDGFELIPLLEKLKVICPVFIITDVNDNILYTLETISEKDLTIAEGERLLEIK
jgi:hypothetical protein